MYTRYIPPAPLDGLPGVYNNNNHSNSQFGNMNNNIKIQEYRPRCLKNIDTKKGTLPISNMRSYCAARWHNGEMGLCLELFDYFD